MRQFPYYIHVHLHYLHDPSQIGVLWLFEGAGMNHDNASIIWASICRHGHHLIGHIQPKPLSLGLHVFNKGPPSIRLLHTNQWLQCFASDSRSLHILLDFYRPFKSVYERREKCMWHTRIQSLAYYQLVEFFWIKISALDDNRLSGEEHLYSRTYLN